VLRVSAVTAEKGNKRAKTMSQRSVTEATFAPVIGECFALHCAFWYNMTIAQKDAISAPPVTVELFNLLPPAPHCSQQFTFLPAISYTKIDKRLCIVTIQPLGNLTGTFRGAVHLQMISEPSDYGKRRSSHMQPE
jgi:hypothetical protein